MTDEINGSGYARRPAGIIYPRIENGTIVGGALDGAQVEFEAPVVTVLIGR